ncbi:Sec-independent protein translocase protein TatB [Sulfurimicrobium lacus]|uniref:Sec-independent protein translocase protein TatB n=1 Tax=Sulfurimicrobium lacus TaxID=2715678 RepID=A0A6F8V6T2_9PROT|nr:Sec-independent protein translocase protein TatB [Sulfurimicrobium lacus]BCB25543.1 Sec-independent protein translocase protein TatB [Sulfurimicrobium lacus]
MFGIEFSELLLIGIVALVVIGPERLPRVARTAGHLFGRVQRYVANVKADINREIHAEELQKLQQEIRTSVGALEESVAKELNQGGQALHDAKAQIHEIIEIPRKPVDQSDANLTLEENSVPVAEEPQPQLELNLDAPPEATTVPSKHS